jgi:hypothetical protein
MISLGIKTSNENKEKPKLSLMSPKEETAPQNSGKGQLPRGSARHIPA